MRWVIRMRITSEAYLKRRRTVRRKNTAHISAKEGLDAEHGKKGLFIEKQTLYAAFG